MARASPGERRTILSEKYAGTMAEKTPSADRQRVRQTANLTTAEAAALGTSWLTAYSLLFDAAGMKPGDRAHSGRGRRRVHCGHPARPCRRSGGVRHLARSETNGPRRSIGADAAFETGARLPHKVDAVIESVGAATWSHSVKSVRPGGTIAICGATTGDQPGAELTRIFFQDIRVQGNTMGSRDDFARLLKFVEHADLHPAIDSTYALADAPAAFRKVVDGDVFGKVVLHIDRVSKVDGVLEHVSLRKSFGGFDGRQQA